MVLCLVFVCFILDWLLWYDVCRFLMMVVLGCFGVGFEFGWVG